MIAQPVTNRNKKVADTCNSIWFTISSNQVQSEKF